MGDRFKVNHGPATSFGWVRRSDIGHNVWEMPDGRLFKAENECVPELCWRADSPPIGGAGRP